MAGDRPPGTPGSSAGNGGGPSSSGSPLASAKPKADKPPASRPVGRPTKGAKRAEHVEKLTARLVNLGVLLALVDPLTSGVVMRRTPAIAEAAADVAEQYPWAAAILDKTVKGGALASFGGIVGMTALEIAANKGLLPDPLNDMFATPAPADVGESPPPTSGVGSRVHGAGAGTKAGSQSGSMSEAARQARDRLAAFAPPPAVAT